MLCFFFHFWPNGTDNKSCAQRSQSLKIASRPWVLFCPKPTFRHFCPVCTLLLWDVWVTSYWQEFLLCGGQIFPILFTKLLLHLVGMAGTFPSVWRNSEPKCLGQSYGRRKFCDDTGTCGLVQRWCGAAICVGSRLCLKISCIYRWFQEMQEMKKLHAWTPLL